MLSALGAGVPSVIYRRRIADPSLTALSAPEAREERSDSLEHFYFYFYFYFYF